MYLIFELALCSLQRKNQEKR